MSSAFLNSPFGRGTHSSRPNRWKAAGAALAFALSALLCGPSAAQAGEPPTAPPGADDFKKAGEVVSLGGQVTLKVPPQHLFLPAAKARKLLEEMGNRSGSGLLGMVISDPPDQANWMAVLQFIPAGYVKDDDAKDWNADDLLTRIREGTEEANAERKSRGISEIDVIGWIERPAYDAASHRLVWSAESREKGAPANAETTVNYNTYLLGREGYVSVNWVTGKGQIEAEKAMAKNLLSAVTFDQGKRYQDFNASTDRVAEYGLAALVAGAAAKKLGLFAAIGVFLLKGWKLLIVGAIALIAILRRFVGGRKQAE